MAKSSAFFRAFRLQGPTFSGQSSEVRGLWSGISVQGQGAGFLSCFRDRIKSDHRANRVWKP